ncbi:Fanconi anemia group F protein [Indicator indicator]|uniref:Fanconi anemia group F protein n=1 Tax=Indicator indicator TaxID=1002788 RepID=UPI0023DE9FC0|nr:Fanconi anemia group F protein [Indicator indicator]
MEAMMEQVEQLPALLAVSRSSLVGDWDSVTLDRALEWARYFQHLHDRFRTRPQLREALGRRLRQGQPSSLLGFPALGRSPQLLGLALLENRALPPTACRRLIHSLLQPAGEEPGPEPRSLPLLARRKAAARLLALLPRGPPRASEETEPQVQAEAQLLLSRLREERQEAEPAEEAAGWLCWLAGVLEQLPQPRVFKVVAAALLLLLGQGRGTEGAGSGGRDEDSIDGNQESATGDEYIAGQLLSWLLENPERFSAFCLFLPGSLLASLAGHYSQLSRPYLDLLTGWGSHLLYDPLQGQWVKSCIEKAQLSWEELKERFSSLCRGSLQLRGQTQAALKHLKARDGDFKVCGLSVWTDLLMEVEETEESSRTLIRECKSNMRTFLKSSKSV